MASQRSGGAVADRAAKSKQRVYNAEASRAGSKANRRGDPAGTNSTRQRPGRANSLGRGSSTLRTGARILGAVRRAAGRVGINL